MVSSAKANNCSLPASADPGSPVVFGPASRVWWSRAGETNAVANTPLSPQARRSLASRWRRVDVSECRGPAGGFVGGKPRLAIACKDAVFMGRPHVLLINVCGQDHGPGKGPYRNSERHPCWLRAFVTAGLDQGLRERLSQSTWEGLVPCVTMKPGQILQLDLRSLHLRRTTASPVGPTLPGSGGRSGCHNVCSYSSRRVAGGLPLPNRTRPAHIQ